MIQDVAFKIAVIPRNQLASKNSKTDYRAMKAITLNVNNRGKEAGIHIKFLVTTFMKQA